MPEKKKITEKGLASLNEELERRQAMRKEIADEIDEARRHGDLSENAEYTEAKNKQAENETAIARLMDEIKNSEVVADEDISTDRVSVGITVVVKDLDSDRELTYSIVGVHESDPLHHRISDESPIGAGLLNAQVGEVRDIEVPSGAVKHFKVLQIKKQ